MSSQMPSENLNVINYKVNGDQLSEILITVNVSSSHYGDY